MKKLLENINTLAIVCNQWGDTGKGKFVDYFATEWADIIARGTGGANAGHTIIIGGKEYIFHLIPSGILHDGKGKINIIGSGVAFDPRVVEEELKIVKSYNLSYDNLKIAYNAKLVLPHHLVLDRLKESSDKKGKIGTTGRGIGPLYTDFVSRQGISVHHMLNKDVFYKTLKNSLDKTKKQIKQFDTKKIKEVMMHEHLLNGEFYNQKNIFDIEAIIEKYHEYSHFFKEMICDTDSFLKENLGTKKILLEGAQGLMLSVDYGTYPYVTSSDPSIRGLAKGVGLDTQDVDLTLGIVKAFYMTRVGEGPFPTEIGGDDSAVWCDTHTKEDEKNIYSDANVNSAKEFEQGVGIRMTGGEYGATTGRPRRTGWLDLPLLKYASTINSQDIILTKVDVLDNCDEINICTAYIYMGDDYCIGNKIFKTGDELSVSIPNIEIMNYCKPIYKKFTGWKSDSSMCKTENSLPKNMKKIINFIEKETNVNVRITSVGPDREETVFMD